MKVKPKLYLNMSPQTAEEGSLAFARNMKIDADGNLVSDYGYKNIDAMADYNIVGHIVGLDNKIYFFCMAEDDNHRPYEVIVEYDEVTETAEELNTEWTYDGGEIDGYVSTNQSGEKILTIAEYKEGGNVPLKHINLSFPDAIDQSVYYQAPACPTANLVLKDTYVKSIPNGVYVFFIRYKIRKDVYTNWFLCSRPVFAGTSENITTLQGGLKYINLHKDAARSFVFQLDFASVANIDSYKEFQLGFIITHDEATDARMWKHFDIDSFSSTPGNNDNLIYFDYEDVKDANIDDLLETTYELYNVRNVTAFKNKLYISNYIESDLNPDLSDLAGNFSLEVVHSGGTIDSYKTLTINNTSLTFDRAKGYYTYSNIGYLLSVNDFEYNITKLAKVSTKEKKDAVKFSLIWNSEYKPDIAVVYNIYNNLYNKQIFGGDYTAPYEFDVALPDFLINSGLGLKHLASGNNLYCYGRPDNDSDKHPWDDLGLTFAFGSFSTNDVGQLYARQGCSYFNRDSLGAWGIGGSYGWVTRDSGFTDVARAAMVTKLKEDIKGKSFFAKAYIEITSGTNIYTIGYNANMDLANYAGNKIGNTNELTNLDINLFSTDTISDTLKNRIKQWIVNAILDTTVFRGIDENGTIVINLNGTDIRVTNAAIKFKLFEFELEEEDVENSEDRIYKNFSVTLKTTDYVSLCTFSLKNSILKVTDVVGNSVQASSLMPLSTYDAYVHFVDEHNIVTNGIKFATFQTGLPTGDKDIISLICTIPDLSDTNYKSCFISLANVGDIVIEGFDYSEDPNNSNPNITTNILHCLELDTMLYNLNDNITIKGLVPGPHGSSLTTITTEARYYPSGTNYPTLAFGNCGYVSWDGSGYTDTTKFYIIIPRNKSSENINNLVKASSYIPLKDTGYSTPLPDGYYGSWLCLVKKPNFYLSSSCYVAGRDIYAVDRNASLTLKDFKNYVQPQDSVTYFIRSNFNLNYLSLAEDINDSIFTVGEAASGVKQVARVINSAMLSSIYELKSMYKDFFNKYFNRRDTDYKIDFDNTVRVSNVLSDETFNNSVFKFKSTDYYNVPTDRGIIVNLFSIGNNIFVHTKTAFYKFDGNQTIAASDNDITLQEAEPFNSGVTQLFDSEYGYGGIENKEAGCITFDSYIFYDGMSNHIFAYSGNGQIQLIDASIYKFLCHYRPDFCRTLHDDKNHRVLFEFTIDNDKKFTISYNYKSKSFVSLHDLSLVNAFHSRYLSYSYVNGLSVLFDETDTIDNTVVSEPMNIYKIYGDATTICFIQFGAETQDVQSSPFNIAVVMFPQDTFRQVINSVKYIADVVKDNYDEKENYDVIKFPQVTRNNPVSKFYVITDVCVSTPVTGTVDDTNRPATLSDEPPIPNALLDYKGFKYDMGSWNTNYFRNNINKTNVYQYPNQPRAGQNPNNDNNSLVYGKYFVLVFDFIKNRPIKFEEISVNSNQY